MFRPTVINPKISLYYHIRLKKSSKLSHFKDIFSTDILFSVMAKYLILSLTGTTDYCQCLVGPCLYLYACSSIWCDVCFILMRCKSFWKVIWCFLLSSANTQVLTQASSSSSLNTDIIRAGSAALSQAKSLTFISFNKHIFSPNKDVRVSFLAWHQAVSSLQRVSMVIKCLIAPAGRHCPTCFHSRTIYFSRLCLGDHLAQLTGRQQHLVSSGG